MSSFTMVYYHIPEDYDDPEQPNAFGIPKSIEEITLTDIKKAFPVEGSYHFRFKTSHNKAIIWMDLSHEDCKVPLYMNRIITKVTRISWESQPQHSPKRQDSFNQQIPRQEPFSQQIPQKPVQPQSPPPKVSPSLNIFEPEPASQHVNRKPNEAQFDFLFPS
ncbi:unnamed protein product [Blepharisma stoltei]|uniref:DIX domain-containing protein n=1 Tax=Blepharisma stoltei TaxID=1481888 RepID=A0AAU9J4Y3_9CILI|nr:unnamed protein product [Blepharisma stoltei]